MLMMKLEQKQNRTIWEEETEEETLCINEL